MQEWKIKSNTVYGTIYTVTNDNGWQCTCPAGSMGKTCIHIKKCKHVEAFGKEMTVNENLVEIVRGKGGRASIEVPLLIGEEVRLTFHGTVVGIEEDDNFNGTYNRIAKVKVLIFEKET